MVGHVILSHGFESSPQATTASTLAAVAESVGFTTERPDFRACDALGLAGSVAPRVDLLRARMRASRTAPILVGSSLGAFSSAVAALDNRCAALFLLATPAAIPGCASAVHLQPGVPCMLVHGFEDDICAPEPVMTLARQTRTPLLLLPSGHRLCVDMDVIGAQFRLFLERLPG